jgi:hypothetical protein
LPDPTSRLRRLERAGIMRVGNASPPLDLLRTPPPKSGRAANAVQALLQERQSGR